MNRLGNVIFYVQNVTKTVEFYEKAFGIPRQFIDETGHYAQLETGETALGFASFELAKQNLSKPYRAISAKDPLPGCEIAFATTNVEKSLEKALKAGAELVEPPQEKPWGQTVAYVRDFNGILIEIGSDMMAGCSTDSGHGCGCC